jgi:phosphoglycerate dehydrogenase-like enzyme
VVAATVWIPAATPREYRALLPDGVDVREVPDIGDISDSPQHADILISGFDPKRTIEIVPQLRDLRLVQTLSAGVDTLVRHIPPDVILCDGSGIHDASVSEWVVMATVAMRRYLPEHVLSQRDATWRWAGGGADLEGATVLIVGFGSIGRAVEQRLEPFGARVVRVARRPREGVHGVNELQGLLSDADVVVILLPLTAETRGMVDAGFLAAMREGALLVNAARGPIVDTEALLAALRSEHIRCALDVTDPEPLRDGHPLWSAPGALITPHIGGAVERLFERAWRFAGEQVRRYIDGEPLRNVVSDGY